MYSVEEETKTPGAVGGEMGLILEVTQCWEIKC